MNDRDFNATIVNYSAKANYPETFIKACDMKKLHEDSENVKDERIRDPSFRWIHLPANNVCTRARDISMLIQFR